MNTTNTNTKNETKPYKAKTMLELFEGHPERWRQGDFGNFLTADSNQFCGCIVGARLHVYGPMQMTTTRASIIQDEIDAFLERKAELWNDSPGRTHADVVELCRNLNI